MAFDHGPCRLTREPQAGTAQEETRGRATACASACSDVSLKPVCRALADRDTPLLASLAVTDDGSAVKVKVCELQRYKFGDAQARGVHHFEHGAVTQTLRRLYVRCSEQALHLVFGEEARQ